jgi:hypothetical protein
MKQIHNAFRQTSIMYPKVFHVLKLLIQIIDNPLQHLGK